jgi:hypothetical protein
MKSRKKRTTHGTSATCPLPLAPEARKAVMAAWLVGIPAEIRTGIEGLRVVELGMGLGPACVAVHIEQCPAPGLTLEDALYRLAGRADMFNRAHVRLSDGQRLLFEPHQFRGHRPPGA